MIGLFFKFLKKSVQAKNAYTPILMDFLCPKVLILATLVQLQFFVFLMYPRISG